MIVKSTVRRLACVPLMLAVMCASQAADIERPRTEIVDKFGVNVATGQVTQSLNTVSIGGPMGLSHRISIYANEFQYVNMRGFNDNMRQITRYVHLSQNPNYSPQAVLSVSDGADSAQFRVEVNGVRVEQFAGTPQPYTYIAVGDERNSLVVNGALLEWTKPDGTVVTFTRTVGAHASAQGLLSEIVYPNGYTITITPGGVGIQSNTGFQLKSIYGSDTRPMGKPNNLNLINVHPATTSQASGWSTANPIQIVAINNALEFCVPTDQVCSLNIAWPTATFDWPAGMPRTMYIGESTISITDAAGGITKYRFLAHDLALSESGLVQECCVPDTEYSPRLVGVTPAGSQSEQFTYAFRNVFVYNSNYFGTWVHRAQNSGVITHATHISKNTSYSMFQDYMGSTRTNSTSGGGITNVVLSAQYGNPDAISYAVVDDGRINFESSARNWPTDFYKREEFGVPERYEYDARGNLTKVSRGQGGNYVTYREAKYADSCTTANRKYCNQAEWIKDARGNVTNYTYHAPSGQLQSVTYPPNKHGIRAQTRYDYGEFHARYLNGSSKISGTAIWLKTSEKHCMNSASTGSGCTGGDEVVTEFEYKHDNLLLTGMTVTEPPFPLGSGTTLRTCFKYDIYGNQIGKTQPKAGLSECPEGRYP